VSLGWTRRPVAVVAGLLLATPAAAYLLPATAILRKAAETRAGLELTAVEATGTLERRGAALPAGEPATVSARLLVKVPGRARLELLSPEVADADRPAAMVREERLAGRGGLEQRPAVAALLRGLATLLAWPTGAEGQALGDGLARRGVRLDEVSLGRQNGRLAWVLGGRQKDPKPAPLALIDKESWMPLALHLVDGGVRHEVRFLDWGSAVGADRLPRAIEVWQGTELLLRFNTEKTTANPRLADALF
jgi:hypothetical protein